MVVIRQPEILSECYNSLTSWFFYLVENTNTHIIVMCMQSQQPYQFITNVLWKQNHFILSQYAKQ